MTRIPAGDSKGTDMHLKNAITEIERYSEKLSRILQDTPEHVLWKKPETIANSIGAITRHLTGNLHHYMGAGVLSTGYIRQRDQEFYAPPVSTGILLDGLRESVAVARDAINSIDQKRANEPHTTPCGHKFQTLAEHVAKITAHFAYHIGEARYASKLLSDD